LELLDVKNDRSLAGGEATPEQTALWLRHVFSGPSRREERADAAGEPTSRRFDLDDVRSEVAQDLGAEDTAVVSEINGAQV